MLVHYGSSSLLLGFCYLTMPLDKTSYHTQLAFSHLLILFQFISDTDAECHCIPSNVVRVESDLQVIKVSQWCKAVNSQVRTMMSE